MKRLRAAVPALVAMLAAAFVQAAPASATPGYVSRSGTSIVSPTGAPMKLNGVNLGGYLLWEGWVIGGGMDAETPMFNALSSLVGTDRATRFRADMRAGYVTAADFKAMRAMGFNSVRIPFNHRVLANDANGGFATLDRLIDQAEQAGVYVILDMHSVPGGQNWGFIADPSGWPDVWASSTLQQQTVDLWKKIAARYANRPIVAGYDLINEPWAGSGAQLQSLYAKIIAGIRSVDRNHMVILEGNQLAHDFSGFTRIDDNSAWSFHLYPFDGGDPNAKLDGWLAAAEAAGVPLWNGEYGQSDLAGLTAQAQRFASRPGLDGQSLWTWKIADRNRMLGFAMPTFPAPVKFTASDSWMALTLFMSQPATAPRPTATQAEAGLQSFISAISPANSRTDNQVATAVAAVKQTDGYTAPAAPAPAMVSTTTTTTTTTAPTTTTTTTAIAASTSSTSCGRKKACTASRLARTKAARRAAARRAAARRKAAMKRRALRQGRQAAAKLRH